MPTENNLSFESDNLNFKSRSILGQPQTPGITKFLMNRGIVKTEKQANYVMLTITILFLLTSIYIFAAYVFDVRLFEKKIELTPEQEARIEANRERMKQMREKAKTTNTNTQNETQTQ